MIDGMFDEGALFIQDGASWDPRAHDVSGLDRPTMALVGQTDVTVSPISYFFDEELGWYSGLYPQILPGSLGDHTVTFTLADPWGNQAVVTRSYYVSSLN